MKTMTCKQLGGACDKTFTAATFDDIAQKARDHGSDMFTDNDPDHLAAMQAMRELMMNPDKMQDWMDKKKAAFEAQPDD